MQEHEAHGSSNTKITTGGTGQLAGRIVHRSIDEPVQVAFTAAGLSLPAGTRLYDQQSPGALIDLIRSDAFAMSFQSVRQYREALLQSIQEEIEADAAARHALKEALAQWRSSGQAILNSGLHNNQP